MKAEIEKQMLELLERNLAFDKDMTFGSSKPCLSDLTKLAKEIASLKMEGMYEREFVGWVIEPDNVFYEDGIYCINDASMEKGVSLNKAYEYWQNNIKEKSK